MAHNQVIIIHGRPGDRAVVKLCEPPTLYELKDGLQPGDVVRLDAFDHGYWEVTRERDGLRSKIFLVNIKRVLRQ